MLDIVSVQESGFVDRGSIVWLEGIRFLRADGRRWDKEGRL